MISKKTIKQTGRHVRKKNKLTNKPTNKKETHGNTRKHSYTNIKSYRNKPLKI